MAPFLGVPWGNNDCIIRDTSKIQQISVGDMLFIKGRGFPQGAKGLVSRFQIQLSAQVENLLDPIVIWGFTPWKFKSFAPEKGAISKMELHLPTILFSGGYVKLRGCILLVIFLTDSTWFYHDMAKSPIFTTIWEDYFFGFFPRHESNKHI